MLTADGPSRPEIRRAWWLALLGFFLLGGGWAVALPTNGTYDEKQHVVRAYAVADGQLMPIATPIEEDFFPAEGFRVPGSLLPSDPHCVWFPREQAASCQGPPGSPERVSRVSGAARYSPVYYLPVGVALLLRPDATGVVLARLVSALLAALLLASAVTAAMRLRSRPVIAAVALVCTPMVVNLAGAVNPNGVEIAAGVLLFAALLALVRSDAVAGPGWSGHRRRLVVLAAVAALVLLTVRLFGPLMFAAIVLACALVARPGRLRDLAGRPEVRWIFGGAVAAGLLVALGWDLLAAATEVPTVTSRARDLTGAQVAQQILTQRVPFHLRQAIGSFGYGKTGLSPVAVLAWYLLLAAATLPGLIADRSVRRATLGLIVFSAVLLVGLDAWFVRSIGWFSQARYVLPAALGGVLLAAVADRPTGRRRAWVTRPALLVALTVPLHGYALAAVISTYRSGPQAPLNPLRGDWTPVWGPILPLIAVVLGGLTLVALVRTLPADPVPAAPVPADTGAGRDAQPTPAASRTATVSEQKVQETNTFKH